MDDITRLKTRLSRSALGTARARGHNMSRVEWRHEQAHGVPDGFGFWRGYAACKDCGMCLQLETRPAPNSIDISGEAVAVNCKGGTASK